MNYYSTKNFVNPTTNKNYVFCSEEDIFEKNEQVIFKFLNSLGHCNLKLRSFHYITKIEEEKFKSYKTNHLTIVRNIFFLIFLLISCFKLLDKIDCSVITIKSTDKVIAKEIHADKFGYPKHYYVTKSGLFRADPAEYYKVNINDNVKFELLDYKNWTVQNLILKVFIVISIFIEITIIFYTLYVYFCQIYSNSKVIVIKDPVVFNL